jgi:hypothetical protein
MPQTTRLALLANLLCSDGCHPILIRGPRQSSHLVAAVDQNRDDFAFDVVLALPGARRHHRLANWGRGGGSLG